ncbi:MAG: SIR2 family protein, partial [Promethearchaeota archaeon]
MSSIKKSKSFNVTKLFEFESDEKLTFLVGAGASVEAPSQLPSTNDAMKALIKLSCANSEIETILKLQNLRFEVLVGIIHKSIEDDFQFLNFFTKSDKPNLEHFVLAEMIKKGHFIFTSNFDSLLEYALLQSDVPKKKIVPVITKKDYEKFSDPEKLYKNGKIPVYKIHGSHRNIITG